MNKEKAVAILIIAGYLAACGVATGIISEAAETIDLIRSDKKLIKSCYEVYYGGSKA